MKITVISLLLYGLQALSLTDSSDQKLKNHADDAMAYVNAISSGKKIEEPTQGTKVESEDLDPESPLFYAQEQDEINRGIQNHDSSEDSSKKGQRRRREEDEEEEFDYS